MTNVKNRKGVLEKRDLASSTIRNLEDLLKRRLRVRAANHGCSMEEEARYILRAELTEECHPARNLGEVIQQRFAAFGGVDLPKMECHPLRASPNFN